MGCLQLSATKQAVNVSSHSNGANLHLRDSSVVMELDNSEWHESHYPSSHTGKNACLLPTLTTNLRGISIGRIHSCDGQQVLGQNMTSWRGGGLSRKD